MTSSFVDWPEINISWWSSHLAITMSLETLISLIYIELFAACIPVQLHIMCALQANIFFLLFILYFILRSSSDASVVHLEPNRAMISKRIWFVSGSEEGRLCTSSEGREFKGRDQRWKQAPMHVGKKRRDDREKLEASAGPASRYGQLTSARTACH